MNIDHHMLRFLHPTKQVRLFWSLLMLVWPVFSSHPLQAKPIVWQRHAFPLPDSIWSMASLDHLRINVAAAKEQKPFNEQERKSLETYMAEA